ncbi:MAG: glucosamine-6-phosphate isomerase [Planctomycetota bacterium]|nr:glucosamine-6-phosphate isomerase [Planctomycetota bacterium]
MNLLTTLSNSLMQGFFPNGWDLGKIDGLAEVSGCDLVSKKSWWNPEFKPIPCQNLGDFDVYMGHEIALEISNSRKNGRELAMILPVGPMGMYRWAVYFLNQWDVNCSHVHGFNMDEWSDAEGNTLPSDNSGAFQFAMEKAFYGPLGKLTVPKNQRNFALKNNLPSYAEKIKALKTKGAKLITVFGIGRVCHIAFWEPHFAAEFDSVEQWKLQTHRLGAKLHPLTIEQNALTSFKSRTTLVPAFANTIGPGLFLQSDSIIGGCDGTFGRGMQWQGLSLRMSLLHEPTPWIPSSFMPTLPGKLFFLNELAEPLVADCN